MEAQEKQTRNGFLKLNAKPQEVDVFTSWRVKKGTESKPDPEFEPDPKECVKAFMHPLTDDELWDIEAVGVESYRSFAAKGGNEKDCLWRLQRVEKCQQLFYSLRVGPEKDAARLFEDEKEIIQLPITEVERLIEKYRMAFIPNKDEIKNSLRERLGRRLGTESSSPKTSKTEA